MLYVIGTTGFICGFFLGQLLLLRLLRGVDNERLLSDKGLRWRYGILNWAVALLTAAAAVWLYDVHVLQ